jgi:hypothetical protein
MKKIFLVVLLMYVTNVFGSGNPCEALAPMGTAYYPAGEGCCNQYYQCYGSGPYLLNCPPGYVWNTDINACDLSSNVRDCQNSNRCQEIHYLGAATITCNNNGRGRCHYVAAEEGLYGACRFYCKFSGSNNNYCSSCWVNLVNFCSAFAVSCGG